MVWVLTKLVLHGAGGGGAFMTRVTYDSQFSLWFTPSFGGSDVISPRGREYSDN